MPRIALIFLLLLTGCAVKKQPVALSAALPKPLTVTLSTKSNGSWWTITPAIVSLNPIYEELWSCENGTVRSGDYPSWYVPPADGSETPVSGLRCEYTKPGTYHPNLQITDTKGNRVYASVEIVIP